MRFESINRTLTIATAALATGLAACVWAKPTPTILSTDIGGDIDCATSDPLLRSVIENYCVWAPRVPWMDCDFFATSSSTLFDDVAVYMAYSGELLNFEEISFSVSDDGYTRRDPDGPYSAKVAISWKSLEAFERWLSHRLLPER